MAYFTLSAFGDEIDADLEAQLALLRAINVNYLELRSAWGVNVTKLDDEQLAKVKALCGQYGVKVSCLGSPVGKSPIQDPLENEIKNMERLFEVGGALGSNRIRLFSFYPPDINDAAAYDGYVDESIARLTRLTELAAAAGFYLMFENERHVVGDSPARCAKIVSSIDSPHFRFTWDSANFVQVGVAKPVTNGWPLLGKYTDTHVHIKDARQADGGVTPAGEGDGELPELLQKLHENDFRGFLAVEPHLVIAGHSGGFSGADGMKRAVEALRGLLAGLGYEEQPAFEP
ncbi:MAG: sugar phosphate isomerase/epimerase [Anaerolineae bacterium]|nr:sugar phosphate isomerase/epimerase [Anaerolineae bacterium]